MTSETFWEWVEYIGMFLAIITATVLLAWLYRVLFERFIKSNAAAIRSNPTRYKFLKHVGAAIIYLIGFGIAVSTIPALSSMAASLLAGAGILAVAVGFASQAALSNIISGIFIVIFKPFGVNDRLKVRDTLQGIVEDITLRHVVIRDFNNQRIIIPNSIISEEVIVNANFEDDRILKFIEIGISYDSDIDQARDLMRDEIMKHPLRIDGRTSEQLAKGVDEVPVRVIALEDSAVRMRAYAWARNAAEGFNMQCDLLESIKKRFDAEGVSIPFPHRTIIVKDGGQGDKGQGDKGQGDKGQGDRGLVLPPTDQQE